MPPKFSPPEGFNFQKAAAWPDWRQRFQRYRIATGLDKDAQNVQTNTLLYAMGPEAEHIYNTFRFAAATVEIPEPEMIYADVLAKFDAHFVPRRNVIHQRAMFHQREQKQSESIEEFIRSLYELTEHCNFGNQRDENIRDRLVVGIRDKELSRDLQLKADLTLDNAVRLAKESEMVKDQIDVQKQPTPAAVAEVYKRKPPGRRNQDRPKGSKPAHGMYGRKPKGDKPDRPMTSNHQSWNENCGRCGRPHGGNNRCPAKGAKCHNCQKLGHFAKFCRRKNVNALEDLGDPWEEGSLFLGSVSEDGNDSSWKVKLPIGHRSVSFKIDTGADVTVISESTFNDLQPKPDLTPSSRRLNSVGGELRCRGTFTATTRIGDRCHRIRIYVVPEGCNLLGRPSAIAMGLVKLTRDLGEVKCRSNVFGDLGEFKCDPVQIRIRRDAEPYSVNTARRIPIPLLPRVKAELDRMLKLNVIQKVTEPTEWCAPMVPVVKKGNRGIRICVDLKKLNKAVIRERYQLPTLDEILPKLKGAKVFSSLDASSGFWAIPLDKNSVKLTTFITPFGRFCFRRLPFGVTSAPEIFQRKMTELLEDHEGVVIWMDDILVFGATQEEHDERLKKVLDTIEKSGLKLNKPKCKIGKTEIDFVGHFFCGDGVSPSTEKVKAVMELEKPTSVTELKRVLGMFNYLGRFVPNMSTISKPMTDLLRKDTEWCWGPRQQESFNAVKEKVCNAPVLTYYDPTKPTTVSADASSYGIGGLLLQDQGQGLMPVAFASRTLSEAEKRYAQIEKEALASVWTCEKFSQYLFGLDSFTVLTDHKPLVPLMNDRDLDKVPIRCQRLLIRMMRFNANVKHVPGKELIVADALSRSPIRKAHQDELTYELNEDISAHVAAVEESWNVSVNKLDTIRRATANDPILNEVLRYTSQGWPQYAINVPLNLKAYHEARNHLSVSQGLLIYDSRIVIPNIFKKEMLDRIHDGHMGITKSRERARACIWWPGITQDVKAIVENCSFCQEHRPTQVREPLICTAMPEQPWERVAADLCSLKGRSYLVVADYFSRYIEVAYLGQSTKSLPVISKMKAIFARWGIPSEVVSDNGPQFDSNEFANFAIEYGFDHITSSPTYAQSNGAVESAVKTAKKLLEQKDPYRAFLAYRNTPIAATGKSPAELMIGRQVRTTLPVLPVKTNPELPSYRQAQAKNRVAKSNDARYYNARFGCQQLPELRPGDAVRVKTDQEKRWQTPAKVVRKCENVPRSYVVETESGTVLRRNRRHLQQLPKSATSDHEVTPSPPTGPMEPQTSGTPKASPKQDTVVRTTSSGRVIKPVDRLDL